MCLSKFAKPFLKKTEIDVLILLSSGGCKELKQKMIMKTEKYD